MTDTERLQIAIEGLHACKEAWDKGDNVPFVVEHTLREIKESYSTPTPTIGDKIRLARANAGYSQKELAALIGSDASYLSRLEDSGRNPSIETLRKIARHTNTTIDQLVIGTEEKESR